MRRPAVLSLAVLSLAVLSLAVLCLAVPLAAGAAAAQSPPRTQPTRDVAVTYQVDGAAADLVPGGLQGPVTLSWDAAGQRLRAEAAGRSQVALIGLRDHAGQALDTSLHVVLPLRLRQDDLRPLTLEGARLTPKGQDVVAGLACTLYGFESAQGPGTVCLTPDGVPLRGQGAIDGKPGRFTALSVQYGPVPADRFTVPPGYVSLGGKDGAAPLNRSSVAGLAQKLGGGSSLGGLRNLLGRAK